MAQTNFKEGLKKMYIHFRHANRTRYEDLVEGSPCSAHSGNVVG